MGFKTMGKRSEADFDYGFCLMGSVKSSGDGNFYKLYVYWKIFSSPEDFT